MLIKKNYTAEKGKVIPFNNKTDFCIGTGHMGLALHKEYNDQLKFVQDKIGFKYIRGHGLFTDDMAIYQEYEDKDGSTKVEYNFTYLDMVMDSYKELGLRPFLELGFMPEKLSSDKDTVFYWKGNITPPKEYKKWTDLVVATLKHLCERYTKEEVEKCPIEVWNEPNLEVFWKNSDMPEYFKLFKTTFLAIKEFDKNLIVGGPAVCGGTDAKWIKAFLEFCRKENLHPDFITRHFYTSMPPEREGHYGYVKLTDPYLDLEELTGTRNLVDSFDEFKGLPIHVTEFNTSYIPYAPVHDTNFNAAYIASLLSKLGDVNESYSYWTFGDVFEESGVPFTPFHGGFGLVANGVIPKPTFYAFEFFKKLQGECVLRNENCVVVKKDNKYYGVAFNLDREGNKSETELTINLPKTDENTYNLITKTVDEDCCNPLRVWHNMGEPANLTKEQLATIKEAARPLLQSELVPVSGDDVTVKLHLKANAVTSFEINPVKLVSDRGYSYERVLYKCRIFKDEH